VSTSCRRKNCSRGNTRSRSMASLVCARPAFNNIAGAAVRAPLSASLNPKVESSFSRNGLPSPCFPTQSSPSETRGWLQSFREDLVMRRSRSTTPPLSMILPGSNDPSLDGAHYREVAHGLRKLARQCRFPGARRELLQLAANYDRRAEHFECRAR